MCVIVYNLGYSEVSYEFAESMFNHNSDGFGITYLDEFKTLKTFDKNLATSLVTAKRPFVAHYRAATSGGISKETTHPVSIGGNNKLFFNGVCHKYANHPKGDTTGIAEHLKKTLRKSWVAELMALGSKFALVSKNGSSKEAKASLIGNWTQENGVWYSNLYFKNGWVIGGSRGNYHV